MTIPTRYLEKIATRVDAAPIEWRKLSDVKVPGQRLRKGTGPLSTLTKSIAKYGVLHPLIVDQHGRLVAGLRRFRAAGKAGLDKVPVRSVALTAVEAAQIELEENIQRANLLDADEARERLAFVAQYREALEVDAQAAGNVVSLGDRHHIRREAIARAGLTEAQYKASQKRAKRSEEMPELDHWGKSSIQSLRCVMSVIPKKEQTMAQQVAALFPGSKASTAVEVLYGIHYAAPDVRDFIYDIAEKAGQLKDPGAVLKALGKGPAKMDPRIHTVAKAANLLGGTVSRGLQDDSEAEAEWFAELRRASALVSTLFDQVMERSSGQYHGYCDKLREALGIELSEGQGSGPPAG